MSIDHGAVVVTGMEDVLAAHVATTHGISGNTDGGYQARRCQCGSEITVHYSEMSDDETDPRLYLNAKFAAHVAEALQAAGFGNLHDAWEEVTANSPRLPNNLRELVFDAVGDVIDKFQFPVQNLGIHPTAVELGDVCGDVEKRVLAIIRAAATYPKVSES